MVAVMSQATKKNNFLHIEVTKEEGHRCDMIFMSDRDWLKWFSLTVLRVNTCTMDLHSVILFCASTSMYIYLVDYAVDYLKTK